MHLYQHIQIVYQYSNALYTKKIPQKNYKTLILQKVSRQKNNKINDRKISTGIKKLMCIISYLF